MGRRRRRIRESKRRHEADQHAQKLMTKILQHGDSIATIQPYTVNIAVNGTGYFSAPSVYHFRRSAPHSQPIGIVFFDGSFLTVKEIFRYDYPNTNTTEAEIIKFEFSYHYQIPHRGFFFRYDYHPGTGDAATHPPYHLHVSCWHEGDDKLPSLPRFRVPLITLEEVLDLIVRDFLNPRETMETGNA